MSDLLRIDYINSLPQPFVVRLLGDRDFSWPVYDIAVDIATFRIDVCGLLEVKSMADASAFRDADGVVHDPDTFWTDYEAAP